MIDTNIKREDICNSARYTKCIDNTISASLEELNTDDSLKLEDRAPNKSKYAVLLIDMQKGFLMDVNQSKREQQIRAQIEVLQYCSQKDIPVAVLEFEDWGDTIDELVPYISKVPRRCNLKKSYWDGFTNDELPKQLNKWNVKNLGIMGVFSSQCIKDTAEGAFKRGYRIATSNALIADSNPNYHKDTIHWFKENGQYYNNYKDLIKQIDLNT